MAYFPDLTPYSYASREQKGVVHVGWLDHEHEFGRGTVAPALIEKMKAMAVTPVELKRGFHVCELCRSPDARSNGEIRASDGGVTYAAPVLIVHYIEEHGYRPPIGFLETLGKVPIQALDPTRVSCPANGRPPED